MEEHLFPKAKVAGEGLLKARRGDT